MSVRTAGLVLLAGGVVLGGLAVRQARSGPPVAAPTTAAVTATPAPTPAPKPKVPVAYTYEVVTSYAHDPQAFTQGLIWQDGAFLESTGLNGQSTLRRVEAATGKVLQSVPVEAEYFAEGMTVLGPRVYQLTWQHQKGFIYDLATFQRVGEFRYAGEGWGLTTDGKSLILSDGSAQLRFLDPQTFAVQRTVSVSVNGRPVDKLNELEFIKGEIFANVWMTDFVVRIDPADGSVTGIVDLSGLLPVVARPPEADVLNGIAYDAEKDRIFVTGKKWDRVFEIRLKAK
ncbi:MAG: glutaminyl-peptide cyclotransferase [Verrucomicrobia bacterium]|nr:glutaminyl-peptide cyclotransferase [Verrucomicrobiota bacterium]